MPKLNFDALSFNRGIISPLALARVDVERTRLSAETQTNWTPKTQGAMRLRPGSKYLGSSASDAAAAWIEFVASTTDTALIELSAGAMRVWVSDALITRPSVSTTISNGTFASATGWTDASTGGGAVSFGAFGLLMYATNIGGVCKVTRQITVAPADQNVEHGLAIVVGRGPVTFRVGSTAGGAEYVPETTIRTGRHSLAFTPTADFYLTFQTKELNYLSVTSIAVEAAGAMSLVTPWGSGNLTDIRYDQSADVVFVACYGIKQMRIERRGTGRSWSVVEYTSNLGPFIPGATSDAKLTPSATYGRITLTANQNFFKSTHVGALFRITHNGQSGTYVFGAEDTVSEVWEVTGTTGGGFGAATERRSVIVTSGTGGTSTITVQKSYDSADVGFRDHTTITTDTSTNIDDSDNNLNVWYRLKIKTGNFVPAVATVTATVTYGGGSKTGIARVVAFTSATSVDADVLSRFSDVISSTDWNEGKWSDAQVFPSSTAVDGRLYWFGGTSMYASVTDDYENFDDTTEGDSAPIIRTIGRGPVDKVNFAIPLLRLVIGTVGSEIMIEASSFGEPLTPTNANTRTISTHGSASLRAIAVDSNAVFVQRSGNRVFLLTFDVYRGTYNAQELTLLVPDLLAAGIVDIAVQRHPDTRIHFVLADGTVAILTYEESEQVMCWTMHKTTAATGLVLKAMALPSSAGDAVYYHVQRTINGSTKRYLERQATELESIGAAANWMMDCAVQVTQASSTTVSGLSHLEGQKVIAWKSSGSGKDLSPDAAPVAPATAGVQVTYTVSGGAITVTEAVTSIIVGLPYMDKAVDEYSARYKSTKLAYGAAAGTALTMPKRVDHIGFILGATHNNGLYSGKDFDTLYPLPRVINGRTITDVDELFTTTTDIVPEPFAGDFDTDSRVCLAAKAPRPATVMAGIPGMATQDVI